MTAGERVEAVLREGVALPVWAIAERAGCHEVTAAAHVKRLRAMLHVAAWLRPRGMDRGPWVAAWQWGLGVDVPRPWPLSETEKSRRYQATEKGKASVARAIAKRVAKRKGDVEMKLDQKRHNDAHYFRKRGPKALAMVDQLLAVLMGGAK